MTASVDRVGLVDRPTFGDPPARPLPAWPVTGILLLYPLWWALGLGVLIFFISAIVMVGLLVHWRARGNRIALPPGFLLWLLFLATVLCGALTLGVDPAGTVPGRASSRLVSYGFRLGGYLSLTVLLVYTGNVAHRLLSQRTLVRLLAWLFCVTVAGGVLGMLAPAFEFASPVEMLLPGRIRSMGFVQSLVHPSAAQVMDIIGGETPRPAAPWGYTNTWGNNVCLLVGWLLVVAWATRPSRRTKLLALATIAVALAPIVYSLNRGLWIGLGVMAGYVAVRLAARGNLMAVAGITLAGVGLVAALVASPLGDVVQARLDNGKSNGVRMYTTQRALAGLAESPLVGFGSTRTTQGGRNSIAVGESADCARCGNFTVGGNGQFWQLLFAHGLIGTVTYFGFFALVLWRFRRDGTAIGLAASAAIVSSFASALWYNSLVTPLALTMLAVAALWRNRRVTT